MTFTCLLKALGLGFTKGLQWAVDYGVPIEKLTAVLFPEAAPAALGAAAVTTLIHNSVLLVEQKYAASGVQSGTGPQKLEEVLLLVGPVASVLLTGADGAPEANYIRNLISAVVAILNAQKLDPAASPPKT